MAKLESLNSLRITDAGRLYGETLSGEGYIMPAKKVLAAGFTKENLPATLFCVVASKEYTNQENGEKFTRNDILATFTSKEAAIEAFNASKVLAIEAESALLKVAQSAGLTTERLAALAAVTI